jgi:hypothetical protein
MIGILPVLTGLFKYKKVHEIDDKHNYEIESLSSESSDIEQNITFANKDLENINLLENKSIENQMVLDKLNLKQIQLDNKRVKKSSKNINKDVSKIDNNKFCNKECNQCWISCVLSKFFYILLKTAKFLGSGSYNDPNLNRLAEYYANIFYTWLKSNDILFINNNSSILCTEFYENYLDYKNKLNYSLIELELGSDTLDEIIKFLDNNIIENLSIKIN